MVHTMLIFPLPLDMQLLVLLLYMIIQALFMEVSTDECTRVKCIPVILIDAANFSLLC